MVEKSNVFLTFKLEYFFARGGPVHFFPFDNLETITNILGCTALLYTYIHKTYYCNVNYSWIFARNGYIGNFHCFNGEKSTHLVLLCVFIIEEVHNISHTVKFPVLDKTIQDNYIQM